MNHLILIAILAAGGDAFAAEPPAGVDAGYLRSQGISYAGKLVGARLVSDRIGEHLLVMSSKSAPSPSKPSARKEYHELAAVYYGRQSGQWQAEWTVRDMVDCPALDSVAEFFPALVSVTDLNQDGRSEITIPYRLFCSGGIDYSTVKVILRDGDAKLAIRGELEFFQPDGKVAIEGSKHYDKALLQPANSAYKRHLDTVWDAVARRK
jgi:hypothetical protein